MASPATGNSPAPSADAYIGKYLSVVSKSDMRYEGVLYYLNPQDATFGLRSVRSFGTEGRRKEGPQVLPDDRVFDYIQFRGSDTKDLKVLPSPTPRDTWSLLDDPAIIQTHYVPPAPTPTSAPYAVSQGMEDLTSIGGLQNYPPVRNFASIGALLPPPSPQVNSSATLPHLQGFGPASPVTGNPYMQQQSLVGQAQGLAALYPVKQQTEYPAFSPSFGSTTSNMHQPSPSLMMPVTLGSLISTPNMITSSAFPSNSLSSSSLVAPNVVSDSQQSLLPTITSSANVPSVSPPTAKLFERISSMPQPIDQSNLVLASDSPNLPSAGGPSTTSNTEESKSSTAVPGQFLQTGPAKCSSSRPSESVCEDVEVVKVLTSESRSGASKDAEAPIFPLSKAFAGEKKDTYKFPSSKKPYQRGRGDMKSGANAPSRKYVKTNLSQTWKKIDGVNTHAHRTSKGSSEERGEKILPPFQKGRTNPETQESMKKGSMEGGKRMNTRSQNYKNGESYAQERGNKLSRLPSLAKSGGNGSGRGRVATEVRGNFKFTEDFDFEAMNEKFNKAEVWGDLGKSREDNKPQVKENTEKNKASDSDRGEAAPAYDKDGFFDSLSNGRAHRKLSERRIRDRETFTNLKIVRENRGSGTMGRGSQSNGTNDGSGRGNAGRGRGRGREKAQGAVWSRVT